MALQTIRYGVSDQKLENRWRKSTILERLKDSSVVVSEKLPEETPTMDLSEILFSQPRTHKSRRQTARELNISFDVILFWPLYLRLLTTKTLDIHTGNSKAAELRIICHVHF